MCLTIHTNEQMLKRGFHWLNHTVRVTALPISATKEIKSKKQTYILFIYTTVYTQNYSVSTDEDLTPLQIFRALIMSSYLELT